MPHRAASAFGRGWLARIPKSLGARLVLILTAVGLAGSLAIALLLGAVITPSFNRLEDAAVDAHVERTRAVLDDVARKVEGEVRDAADRSMDADPDGDGIVYVANDGSIAGARWIDQKSSRDQPVMRERLIGAAPGMNLATVLGDRISRGFYMRLGDRLAAVGVARVPRGHVLVARELSSAQLSTMLQLAARVDLASPPEDVTVDAAVETLGIAVPIAGADGRPVAAARFDLPRDLSLLGRQVLFFAVGGAVVLLMIVLLVLRRMIGRLVLKPLNRVERHMGVVQTSGTLGLLTDDHRPDEIGSLVTSFNAMLRQLKDLREQVEVQSFRLGQSESAVAVMHNVRNALNPISTILSQGLAAPPAIEIALLDRAFAELAGDDIPPARRRKLAAFAAAAAHADLADRLARRQGMEMGREALHNVLEIIGQQQEQTHEKPPLAVCDLSDVVARNAAIARYSGGISIAFVFPSKPHWALANRVILSQVIGNLLANAGEAIAARDARGGSIAVAIVEHGAEANGRVDLTIRDDGEGFDPAMQPQLFQRGFSTRAHKSGGLGLHWCANAMLAMGGSLRLESDGEGLGARAVLSLQRPPAELMPHEMAA